MTATIDEPIARPTTWEQVTEQIESLESSLPPIEQLSEDITKIIDREGQRELLN